MLVVADTSPLNYLILIDAAFVLPVLFEQVCVPEEVSLEMSGPLAPKIVRSWIVAPPRWFQIYRSDKDSDLYPALAGLDRGESSALALAMALQPDFVLIDERDGTRIALGLGLRPTGTLGVLDLAASRGLIDLPETIDRLKSTNFRYPRWLVERLLAEDLQRKALS